MDTPPDPIQPEEGFGSRLAGAMPAEWAARRGRRADDPARWRRQRPEVIPEANPERRGGPVVVADQRRSVGAIPGVPGPSQVGDRLGVRPAHELVDVAVATVVLTQFTGYHRNLCGEGRDRVGP